MAFYRERAGWALGRHGGWPRLVTLIPAQMVGEEVKQWRIKGESYTSIYATGRLGVEFFETEAEALALAMEAQQKLVNEARAALRKQQITLKAMIARRGALADGSAQEGDD